MAHLHHMIPLKQKLNSAAADFYKAVEKLEATGVLVKSIEDGLLDFPTLCWKAARIHVLDSGEENL